MTEPGVRRFLSDETESTERVSLRIDWVLLGVTRILKRRVSVNYTAIQGHCECTIAMAQSQDVTESIVRSVAEYENASPEDLPPLAEKIPSNQFDRLTAPESRLSEPMEFEYLWYQVTVHPDSEVTVTP